MDNIWKLSPDCTIVLSSLLINREPSVDQKVRALNAEIQDLAHQTAEEGRRIVFVDMHGQDGPLLEDLTEDGTHPNDKGYEKMAKLWSAGVCDAVAKGFLASSTG